MRLLKNLYDIYLHATSKMENTDHKKHKTHTSWDTGLDSIYKDNPWNPHDKCTNTQTNNSTNMSDESSFSNEASNQKVYLESMKTYRPLH